MKKIQRIIKTWLRYYSIVKYKKWKTQQVCLSMIDFQKSSVMAFNAEGELIRDSGKISIFSQ